MSLNGGGGNVYVDPALGIVYLFLFKKVRTGENFFGPTYKTTYVVEFDLNREEVLFKWSVPDGEEIDGMGIPWGSIEVVPGKGVLFLVCNNQKGEQIMLGPTGNVVFKTPESICSDGTATFPVAWDGEGNLVFFQDKEVIKEHLYDVIDTPLYTCS